MTEIPDLTFWQKIQVTSFQNSAMRLVHNERNGEAFDSQLVIGVRESYVNLCSNTQDKLQVSLILLLFKLTITSLLLINITVRLLKVLCDRFSVKGSPNIKCLF